MQAMVSLVQLIGISESDDTHCKLYLARKTWNKGGLRECVCCVWG